MKRRKTLLIVFAIILSLLIFSIVYAGFSINLEKHVLGLQPVQISTTTTYNYTFNIYDSATATIPIASQTFALNEIILEPYTQYASITSTFNWIPSTKLSVDFTNTDAITRDMDLWVEIEFDGVVKGNREQVKHEAWSMFSYDSGGPSGIIVAWSGSIDSIPQGWALCDGTNGTPDLRSAFIIGASNQSMVGSNGFFRHTHRAGGYNVPISYSPTATPPTTTTPVLGTSASIQSLPVPYYSLAYIMKL